VVPSPPSPADLFDAGDAIILAQAPTAHLIKICVGDDGKASLAVPRAEVGQGMTTMVAMLIAEELDIAVADVRVSLATSRPELLFNQITGGSTGTRTLFRPVRVAAALARKRLVQTAGSHWGVDPSRLTTADGVVHGPNGQSATYASLAREAASATTVPLSAPLKDDAEFTVIGRPLGRIDAMDIVTGRKQFTMDLPHADAKPTMICRPPTLKARVLSADNLDEVREMPGVLEAVVMSTGVAVVAETFGQCIDGVRALEVKWSSGPLAQESDVTVLARLKNAALPLLPAAPLTTAIDGEYVFSFVSNGALETNCAIADVRDDRAEVWAALKTPVYWQQEIARRLGLPLDNVTVHVPEGGGSFGRKLFGDAALEAVEISQLVGRAVKLMWHRADDVRHGRLHPMSMTRVRATLAGNSVVTFEQRHTGVATDFGHGFGEMITATVADLPAGNLAISGGVFNLIVSTPYNYGLVTQLLSEVETEFPTSSMRDVWSPNLKTAQELMTDRLARRVGEDPYRFRLKVLKNERQRAVLRKAAELGEWGRSLPTGVAQGIAFHEEYRSCSAVLVEIDCRPETVNRPIRNGVTGPRVTRIVGVVDAGLPVNPRGLEAQMMGGMTDGIGLALTYSAHIVDGLPQEASWDNAFYTRQWNMPTDFRVHVMAATTGKPGGFGEVGVAPSMAAVACAYAWATGSHPTLFPINHDQPLAFDVKPRVPPVPASPTDGLSYTF